MRVIRKIARLELSALFYSPIAWSLLILFFVQSSMAFVDRISDAYRNKVVKGEEGNEALTAFIFSDSAGLLSQASGDLYLLVPLLTMGLFSKEYASGSIKLLLSSPIRITDIIVGKYLAVLMYSGLLMVVLIVWMLISGLVIESPDYPAVVTGIFGIYLLACTYGAIGLFMSSLTSNEVTAAVSTLCALAAFNFIGQIGYTIPVFNEIAYWLWLPRRMVEIREGLISTQQVFYYIIVTLMFISFTVLKLSAGQKIESWGKRATKYTTVAFVAIAAGYITSLPDLRFYFDMTRIKSNSLTPESIDTIEKIQGDWTVATYGNLVNMTRGNLVPKSRKHRFEPFEKYVRYNPNLNVEEFVYYSGPTSNRIKRADPGKTDLEHALEFAKQNRINPNKILTADEMAEIIDLEPENYRFVYELSWNGESAVMRPNRAPGASHLISEQNITTSLKHLLIGSKKIAYVTGHGERRLYGALGSDYQNMLTTLWNPTALINQGFDIFETNLATPISMDTDILFIADPQQDYSNQKIEHIRDYIARGGNMIIAGEHKELNEILSDLGVGFMEGQVLEVHDSVPLSTVFGQWSDSNIPEFILDSKSRHLPMKFHGVVGISMSHSGPFAATPILTANPKTTRLDQGSAEHRQVKNSHKAPIPLAVALSRQIKGREQRIFVIGDADFISNSATKDAAKYNYYNESFVTNIFSWLTEGEYPFVVKRADFQDKHLLIEKSGILWLKLFLYGLMPVFILIGATTVLVSRRRK